MKIGIVGLGLIGGSLFKSLKKIKKYELIGISRSVKEKNISNDYSTLKSCDVIFVCTPMNKTLDILKKLENNVTEKTIVCDTCSLKEFVSKNNYCYKFIPTHPMAGTENSGWESSFDGLFEHAKWVITPTKNNLKKDIKTVEGIIKDLKAEVVITTPKEHDKAVALISHAPLVISQALCDAVIKNDLAQKLASSGFKDTTRLSLSNTELACDMVFMNKKNIENSINSYIKSLNKLINSKNYSQKAERIKNFRKNLFVK